MTHHLTPPPAAWYTQIPSLENNHTVGSPSLVPRSSSATTALARPAAAPGAVAKNHVEVGGSDTLPSHTRGSAPKPSARPASCRVRASKTMRASSSTSPRRLVRSVPMTKSMPPTPLQAAPPRESASLGMRRSPFGTADGRVVRRMVRERGHESASMECTSECWSSQIERPLARRARSDGFRVASAAKEDPLVAGVRRPVVGAALGGAAMTAADAAGAAASTAATVAAVAITAATVTGRCLAGASAVRPAMSPPSVSGPPVVRRCHRPAGSGGMPPSGLGRLATRGHNCVYTGTRVPSGSGGAGLNPTAVGRRLASRGSHRTPPGFRCAWRSSHLLNARTAAVQERAPVLPFNSLASVCVVCWCMHASVAPRASTAHSNDARCNRPPLSTADLLVIALSRVALAGIPPTPHGRSVWRPE